MWTSRLFGAALWARSVPIAGTDHRTGEHCEYWAFVPDRLPMEAALRPDVWRKVAEAEAALARLDQAGRQVPSPRLLRRPTLQREAQSTSALEGTFAPFVDVIEADSQDGRAPSLELHEVLNYIDAAGRGLSVGGGPTGHGRSRRRAPTNARRGHSGRPFGCRRPTGPTGCHRLPGQAGRRGTLCAASARRPTPIGVRRPHRMDGYRLAGDRCASSGPRWRTTSSRRCIRSQTGTAGWGAFSSCSN